MPPPRGPKQDKPPREKPQRKKLLILVGAVIAILVGIDLCDKHFGGPSDSEVNTAIVAGTKQSMQHTFDTDSQWSRYHMTVADVVVIKKSGNEYQGMATITTPNNAKHDVLVQITADPNGPLIWKTEPGAFLFLSQDDIASSTPSWGRPPS